MTQPERHLKKFSRLVVDLLPKNTPIQPVCVCVHMCARAKSMKGQRFEKQRDDHYPIIKVVTFNNPDNKSLVELLTVLQYGHPQDSFKCPDQGGLLISGILLDILQQALLG